MEKKCTKCKEIKNLCEFNKNKTRKDGLNNICRVCSNLNSNNYFNTNKIKHALATRENNKKTISENRSKYFQLLSEGACTRCNEKSPFILEYDHKDGVEKLMGVGKMVSRGYKWETILLEIDKCVLLCANCHRKRTAEQFGWYVDLIE